MTLNQELATGTHQAFVIHGKCNGAIIEMPLKAPGADEIRIKVAYVGICGSDLHYYFEGANGSFAINVIIISLVFFYSFRKLVNDLIFTILGLLLAEIELDLVQVEVN